MCHINVKRKSVEKSEAKVLTVQEFQSEDPIDIAMRYAEDLGIAFDDEMRGLFDEVLTMLNADSRKD